MNSNPDTSGDNLFGELDPEPRLLMGPGPVNVYPRVLRAMSTALQGQFDPQFTEYMNQTMALYRQVFESDNQQTFLVNGTARAGIEACMASIVRPGDTVLVPIFGRFGHLLTEIANRLHARTITIETEWGTVFEPDQIEQAIRQHQPQVLAICHGDTSTTMAQPLAAIGEICTRTDTLLYVDATATLGGNLLPVDDWQLDIVSAGLQKCLSGPPGSSPITFNDKVAERVTQRQRTEAGIRSADSVDGNGPVIQSNYFDLSMLMDYWSPKRLNHHTESATMLYAARECARVLLGQGLHDTIARHELTSLALRQGLIAMGLTLFGDQDNLMTNVTGVHIPAECGNGSAQRQSLLIDFGIEIGTSFGPLDGRIWRIGTMGHVCRKSNVLQCLTALESVLRRSGCSLQPGAAVDAALEVYSRSESSESTV